jgi:LEA14-like dessication related protein
MQRARRGVLMLLMIAAAMLAGGCSGLFGEDREAPQVSMADLALSRPGLFSQDLTIVLAVRNRAPRDLTIDAISCELAVNGATLGSGVALRSLTIGAGNTGNAEVPVSVKTQDILNAMFSAARSARLAYTLSGTLRLAGGGSFPFEDEGELTLPAGLPGV